jgi:hypothetical protein
MSTADARSLAAQALQAGAWTVDAVGSESRALYGFQPPN